MSELTQEHLFNDFKQAKLRLLNKKHNAFIGSLLYDLQIKPMDKDTIQLDSLNQTININPDWFCRMTHEHQASALAHEVYHYALMHDVRRGFREKGLYQKACDEVVNNLLLDSDFELPPDIEVRRDFRHLATETVYNLLEAEKGDNPDDNQNNPNNNSLGNDLPNLGNQPSPQELAQMQSQITKANTQEQLVTGKNMQAGTSGQVFEQLFKDINKGKLSWIQILQEYLDELSQGELDFSRFNPRYLPYELYYPQNKSEHFISKVAVAFDVSGSVSEEQIKAFLREMKLIKHQLEPETMDVVTFNHNIVDVFEFKKEDTLDDVTMKISGGTDLYPVFDYYKKPENSPKFLIVFSDLECDPVLLQDKPDFEVIWICIDNTRAETNFGKLIHITSEELESNEQ